MQLERQGPRSTRGGAPAVRAQAKQGRENEPRGYESKIRSEHARCWLNKVESCCGRRTENDHEKEN